METKQKMVGASKVTEKKTTLLKEDGTKEIDEEVIDDKGSTVTRKHLGKDDKPIAIE